MPGGRDDRSQAGWWERAGRAIRRTLDWHKVDVAGAAADGVHRSRAIRRVLELLQAMASPVIVDLGPGIGSNVSFLGERLHCTVHIEDLYCDIDRLTRAGQDGRVASHFSTRLSQQPGSVDAVLAWDLFDYLDDDEAEALVARVQTLMRPGGVVVALFGTVLIEDASCCRYTIVDPDHLLHRRVPFARRARRVWTGRDVSRLFAPMEVAESHLLTHHQRETLLRRPTVARKDR